MWLTCEQSGYITPAILGVPISGTESKRGPHVGKGGCITVVVLVVPTLGRKQKPNQHVGNVAT